METRSWKRRKQSDYSQFREDDSATFKIEDHLIINENDTLLKKSISVFKLQFALSSKFDILITLLACFFSICFGSSYNLFEYIVGNSLNHLILNDKIDKEAYLLKAKKDSLIFFICGLAAFFCALCHFFLWNYNGKKLALKYKEEYFRIVLAQEQSWFDKNNIFEISSKIESQTKAIEEGLGLVIGNSISSLSVVVSGLVFGIITSWKLALLCLITTPVIILIGFVQANEIEESMNLNKRNYEKAQGIAQEVLYNFKTVSSFSNYKFELERFEGKLDEAFKSGIRRTKTISFLIASLNFLTNLGFCIGVCYAAYLIRDKDKSSIFGTVILPGDVNVVLCAISYCGFGLIEGMPCFKAVIDSCNSAYDFFQLRSTTPAKKKKRELSEDQELKNGQENEKQLDLIKDSEIEFKNVEFAYPTNPNKKVLDGVSFKLQKNSLNAFIGASGSGKTTIISLVERFYDKNKGEILISGNDIESLDKEYLRSLIGFVPQEAILFNKSIRENILIGREGITDAQLLEACEMAHLSKFIANLENGLDTIVGVKGSKISGGEKQRIAIARAIIAKPKILIFDEATSALDNKSERKVQKAIDSISRQITTIVIAHRLSTIVKADKIFVLKDGKIVESGNHSALLCNVNSYYTNLIKHQLYKKTDTSRGNSFLNESFKSEYEWDDSIALFKDKAKKKNINNSSSTSNGTSDNITEENSLLDTVTGNEQEEEEKKRRYLENKKKLFDIVYEEKKIVIISILSSVTNGIVVPLIGLYIAFYIEKLVVADSQNIVKIGWNYFILLFSLRLLSSIANYLQNYSFEVIGEHLTKRLRAIVFEKYLRMEIGFHDRNENNPGALLTRLSYHAANLNSIVLSSLGVLIQSVLILVVSNSIGFFYNWKIGLINIAAAPIFFFSSYSYLKVIQKESKLNEKSDSQVGELLSECICNSKTVFAYNFQRKAVEIYKEILGESQKTLVKDSILKGFLFGLSQGLTYLPFGVIFYWGAVFISEGSATFGDTMKAFFTVSVSYLYLGMSQKYISHLQKANESLKNLIKIQEKQSLQDPFNPQIDCIHPNTIKGKIEFKNVSFCYPTRKKLVLKNVSFVIEPGQIAGFVGPSGSGKSTIVQLIERFYDIPNDDFCCGGEILLDDVDIRLYDPQSLRNFISIVSQEPVLFNISVKDNIRYGKLDALESEIEKAAEIAQIKHLLNQSSLANLPVSGGEKQRIAIARAIIRNPKILLLDESTSALDKNTELEIQKSLDEIMKKRTSIVIAHRLSTIQNADIIFVMENGSIIEKGNHEKLLSLKGRYYDLVKTAS